VLFVYVMILLLLRKIKMDYNFLIVFHKYSSGAAHLMFFLYEYLCLL
jgi:hypothetical protein